MKNINTIQTLVATLKHTPHRYWFTLGILEATEFDISKCHTVMGKWWRDYSGIHEMVDAAIADGFEWFERLRQDNTHNLYRGFCAHFWSACRCLRYIANQDEVCLLIEDDKKLNIKWKKLQKKIRGLPDDTEIVVLATADNPGKPFNKDWIKGPYPNRSGSAVVLYTPTGAKIALKIAEKNGHTLENLARHYPAETAYYANLEGGRLYENRVSIQDMTIHDCVNAEFAPYNTVRSEFRGYGHHNFYDRWVNGLNIDA